MKDFWEAEFEGDSEFFLKKINQILQSLKNNSAYPGLEHRNS